MKPWFERNKQTLIATTFLIPILLVAFVSISHVTTWYGLSNPLSWATYLSLAIEIAALSALAGMTVGMRKFIYLPFGLVTLIQLVGNIFYSFHYIDVNSDLFKSWVDLTSPLFSMMGIDDANGHRRILAFLSGGLLPMISLTFLHMLVKSTDNKPLANDIREDLTALTTQEPEPPAQPAKITTEQLDKLQNLMDKWQTKEEVVEPPQAVQPTPSVSESPVPTPTPSVSETPQPTPTPSVSLTPEPTPTPIVEVITDTNSPFTKVGGLLKKVQYDNSARRKI
jgi:hypothetical protein